MRGSLGIGGTLKDTLTCLAPIPDRGINEACSRIVVRQDLRLDIGGIGKSILQDRSDARMQLLPSGAQQRAVGGILHQGVLEGIDRIGRSAALRIPAPRRQGESRASCSSSSEIGETTAFSSSCENSRPIAAPI